MRPGQGSLIIFITPCSCGNPHSTFCSSSPSNADDDADHFGSDLDEASLWEVRRLRLAVPEELGTADIPLTESSLLEAFRQLSGAADQVKSAARGLQ